MARISCFQLGGKRVWDTEEETARTMAHPRQELRDLSATFGGHPRWRSKRRDSTSRMAYQHLDNILIELCARLRRYLHRY